MEQSQQVEAAPKKMGRPPKAKEPIVETAVGATGPKTEAPGVVSVSDIVHQFKAQGIPVVLAKFHQPVRNESVLYHPDHTANHVKERKAIMYLTPLGLIFEQQGRRAGVVPHANIINCDF